MTMKSSTAPIRLEPLKSRHGGASPGRPARKAAGKTSPPGAAAPARPEGLAELRERNGVSLNDIAEATRIPLRHLEELERGDVSKWPPGVYAKSWARDYANEAGIDPDRVSAFVAPKAEVDISPSAIGKARTLRDRVSRGRATSGRGAASTLVARIATVVLVLMLLAIAAVYVWKKTEPASPGGAASQPVGTSGVTPGPPPQ